MSRLRSSELRRAGRCQRTRLHSVTLRRDKTPRQAVVGSRGGVHPRPIESAAGSR